MNSKLVDFSIEHASLTRRYFLRCGTAGLAALSSLPLFASGRERDPKLQRALDALEAEGLIWRRQGKGTFAGKALEPVSQLAAQVIEASEPIEVMEARLCLEPEIAALCATRATPADVARMWTLARHVYEVEDDDMTELWDSALHRLIAQCAGNRPLQTAFALLDDTRATVGWRDMRPHARSVQSLQESHAQHIAIVRAIEAGDANGAREAMQAHLMARLNALSQAMGAMNGNPGSRATPPADSTPSQEKP